MAYKYADTFLGHSSTGSRKKNRLSGVSMFRIPESHDNRINHIRLPHSPRLVRKSGEPLCTSPTLKRINNKRDHVFRAHASDHSRLSRGNIQQNTRIKRYKPRFRHNIDASDYVHQPIAKHNWYPTHCRRQGIMSVAESNDPQVCLKNKFSRFQSKIYDSRNRCCLNRQHDNSRYIRNQSLVPKHEGKIVEKSKSLNTNRKTNNVLERNNDLLAKINALLTIERSHTELSDSELDSTLIYSKREENSQACIENTRYLLEEIYALLSTDHEEQEQLTCIKTPSATSQHSNSDIDSKTFSITQNNLRSTSENNLLNNINRLLMSKLENQAQFVNRISLERYDDLDSGLSSDIGLSNSGSTCSCYPDDDVVTFSPSIGYLVNERNPKTGRDFADNSSNSIYRDRETMHSKRTCQSSNAFGRYVMPPNVRYIPEFPSHSDSCSSIWTSKSSLILEPEPKRSSNSKRKLMYSKKQDRSQKMPPMIIDHVSSKLRSVNLSGNKKKKNVDPEDGNMQEKKEKKDKKKKKEKETKLEQTDQSEPVDAEKMNDFTSDEFTTTEPPAEIKTTQSVQKNTEIKTVQSVQKNTELPAEIKTVKSVQKNAEEVNANVGNLEPEQVNNHMGQLAPEQDNAYQGQLEPDCDPINGPLRKQYSYNRQPMNQGLHRQQSYNGQPMNQGLYRQQSYNRQDMSQSQTPNHASQTPNHASQTPNHASQPGISTVPQSKPSSFTNFVPEKEMQECYQSCEKFQKNASWVVDMAIYILVPILILCIFVSLYNSFNNMVQPEKGENRSNHIDTNGDNLKKEHLTIKPPDPHGTIKPPDPLGTIKHLYCRNTQQFANRDDIAGGIGTQKDEIKVQNLNNVPHNGHVDNINTFSEVDKDTKIEANEKPLTREHLAREQLAREQLAREQLAREQLAREQLAREQLAREKLAREQLAREQLAKGQLAREQLAREQLARGQLAKEQLAREQLGREPPPSVNKDLHIEVDKLRQSMEALKTSFSDFCVTIQTLFNSQVDNANGEIKRADNDYLEQLKAEIDKERKPVEDNKHTKIVINPENIDQFERAIEHYMETNYIPMETNNIPMKANNIPMETNKIPMASNLNKHPGSDDTLKQQSNQIVPEKQSKTTDEVKTEEEKFKCGVIGQFFLKRCSSVLPP